MMKSFDDFADIIDRIEYPGLDINLFSNLYETFLIVECREGTCNVTGKPKGWKGRKWRLSPFMTDGEVVQTAFMAIMAANEHETREQFTYRGVSVFDPHYDIDKLVELRKQPDALKEREPVE
jgi:hypothetical protein